MMFIGLFWLVAILLVVRWLLPGEPIRRLPADPDRLEGEVRRLREEVDHLSGEVRRLLDEQSFLLRLLDGGGAPERRGRAIGEGEGVPRAGLPPPDPEEGRSIH